ncbi:hypothetical protein D1007_18708 [Hordeum vulgare]|nr:hypothetical protein D1007_18708 [Hordeum vulgare]
MAAEDEATRNRPPPVPQLRTPAEQMAFLVSIVQGMEKNIQEIMQNQKSLERVVETKFHNMDVTVTELTTIFRQLQHEVDSVEIPCSEEKMKVMMIMMTRMSLLLPQLLGSTPGLGQLLFQLRRQVRHL